MTDPISLPEELLMAIGSESKEFAVVGKRAKPLKGSVSDLILGSLWVVGFLWLGYFLYTQSAPADTLNAVAPADAASSQNLPATDAGSNIGSWIFYVVYAFALGFGLWRLGKTIIPLTKKGGIFVGTPKRLLNYRNGELFSYEWEQFTMKTKATGNATKGNLTLTRTTGYNIRVKGTTYYIPYIVFMSGIPDVFEIEKICKKRIKESDKLFV